MAPRIKEPRVVVEDQGMELLLSQILAKKVTKIVGNCLGLAGPGGPQEVFNGCSA